ncbi:MAG: M1 family aminopeptidase [Gemmatimonadota bacterium]|nr:M1 family aminopeptidase [Gemmatimonadota bacterium]
MGRTEERVKEEHHVRKWIGKWTVATALLVFGRTPKVALLVLGLTPKVALLVLGLTPGAALANDGYPRMDDVDILHYRIQLEIGETGRTIQGETTILAEMLAGGRNVLPLDLGPLTVGRVTVGGRNAVFTHSDHRLNITFENSYAAGDTVTVIVSYGGEPVDGLFIQPNKFGDRSVFADNWPNRARHWFPGVDHPYDKATVEFIVTAPAAYDVVANGRMLETTTVPPERKRTHWKTDVPIPTYCMVIGAARFSIVRPGSWRGIPVSYYLFPGDLDAGTTDFARSTDMLAFYTDLIGPYPYAKLALVQSSTRFGGMENASAIFFSEHSITGTRRNEAVVAHEIVHQWFGDSVTESDWHHLWLSEGFATYFGAVFFEEADGDERFHEMLDRSRSRVIDADRRAPAPIFNPGITDLFDLLNAYNYSKGGLVLHMLRGLMGDDAFFEGIRDFYARFRDQTVLTRDFQSVMETRHGEDLGWFFDQWIYRAGHPVVEVTWSWDEQRGEVSVRLRQTQPQETFRLPVTLAFVAGDRLERRQVELRERSHEFRFKLEEAPGEVAVDPDAWLLMEARVRRGDG